MIATQYSKQRRDMLRAARRCINGPAAGAVGLRGTEHGPVVSGGKCARCLMIHRKTREASVLTVACPHCGSPIDKLCRSTVGQIVKAHFERRVLAASHRSLIDG